MRPSPSIVPPGGDQGVYLVLDDFGSGLGRAWRETDVEHTDLEAVITDLLDGQCNNPVRVIGFNVAEGWSRDVSQDVAHELRQRCADQRRESKTPGRPHGCGKDGPWGLAITATRGLKVGLKGRPGLSAGRVIPEYHFVAKAWSVVGSASRCLFAT
jgi:hypothetical protein